jgi:hypothetical protein
MSGKQIPPGVSIFYGQKTIFRAIESDLLDRRHFSVIGHLRSITRIENQEGVGRQKRRIARPESLHLC